MQILDRLKKALIDTGYFVAGNEEDNAPRLIQPVEPMPQPQTKCDPQLFAQGVGVCIIDGLASTAVEAQVVRWQRELQCPLDWHYVGGRAVVRCYSHDCKRVARHIGDFQARVVLLPGADEDRDGT